MMRSSLYFFCLLGSACSVNAGVLGNGSWQPGGCGNRPEAPVVDDSSIDSYNVSIAAINEWQQKSKSYFECLVKEANADNATIANSANQAQAQYRETFDRISAAADAASKKLNQ